MNSPGYTPDLLNQADVQVLHIPTNSHNLSRGVTTLPSLTEINDYIRMQAIFSEQEPAVQKLLQVGRVPWHTIICVMSAAIITRLPYIKFIVALPHSDS